MKPPQLSKATTEASVAAATAPAVIQKGSAEAAQAAVAAKYADPLARAKLQDTISASTDARAKAQQQGDQHGLMLNAQRVQGQMDKDVVLKTIDRAISDSQRPLATGRIGQLMNAIVPAVGDYAPNSNYLANDLHTIGTNNAMLNILSQRAQSPTGSTGMRVTQQEFNAFRDAMGSLNMNQSAGQLKSNLQIMRDIWRKHILQSNGIDPTKSKLLMPTGSTPQKRQPPPRQQPQPNRVIDWHDLP